MVEETDDETVDNELADDYPPDDDQKEDDPEVLEDRVLLDFERVVMVLPALSWDGDPAPVAQRPERLSEELDDGEKEGQPEAAEDVAHLGPRTEQVVGRLHELVLPIEHNRENESPDERGVGAEGLEEGLGETSRVVGVKLAGRRHYHPLHRVDEVGNGEVDNEAELASLRWFVECEIAHDDEETAEHAHDGAGHCHPVDYVELAHFLVAAPYHFII